MFPSKTREKLWRKFFYYLSFGYHYGVILFTILFAVFLGITLAYPDFPPGMHCKVTADGIEYGVRNAFEAGLCNGIIYGVIIWLVLQWLMYNIFQPT